VVAQIEDGVRTTASFCVSRSSIGKGQNCFGFWFWFSIFLSMVRDHTVFVLVIGSH